MNLLDRISYDTGGYTVQEILSSFCNKILEIIDLVNKNEKVCNEANTIIENIRNEVVPDLVDDLIKEMKDNRYFDNLVNVTLIEQIRTELTTLLNNTITHFTSRLDNTDLQLADIVREVKEDYYKKDSVNSMVNNKVTKGEARENTDVRPINHREFDSETKQLLTGGSVAVVGENAVGTENVKDLAITSNKRTTTGSAVKISSLSPEPIMLDVNNKKLILPVGDYNLIYYNNKFDKLVSGLEIDVSGNGTTCSLYYDSVSKSFKTHENDMLNENCILIGTVFWNKEYDSYVNSNLNCDYVLKNGDEINHKIMGRISNNFIYPQGKEIRIFSAFPIDIDLVNKKLVINKSGYCKILINGFLRNVMQDEIDISINDYHVSIL